MRRVSIILSAGLLLSGPFLYAQDGLFASFRLGAPFSGTSVGLRLGPLAAYGGLDIITFSASFDDESTTYEKDWNTGNLYKYRDRTESLDGSARLIMPQVGARLHLAGQTVNLYLHGNAQLTIPSVEGHGSYKSIRYNPDGSIAYTDEDDYELTDEDKERIHDVLDFISVSVGFGAEHYFSNHFSIGGEFGLRLFLISFENEGEEEDVYNGSVDWRRQWKTVAETSLGTTYTQFTLNYYFE